MEEKSPLARLKELLPNLEGKVHLADYDTVKEVIAKASDSSYSFRKRFLGMTTTYLENNTREAELYRTNSESRNLMQKAIEIIKEL